MKLKLILLVAIMSLAVTAGAFAAVENIRISGDINAEAVARDLSLGGTASHSFYAPDGNIGSETFVLSQIRLRIDADLTEGVGATIGLINERLWGVASDENSNTDIDLDLAYITLSDFMGQPMTVKIGRQNIEYGHGLIIGDPDTNQLSSDAPLAMGDLSLRKSFDAARVVMDYAPYTVDLLYAKISEGETYARDDTNIWGTNVAYDWDNGHGITEGYFFHVNGGHQGSYKETINVAGARTFFHLSENISLGAEGAFQFGKVGLGGGDNSKLKAYAGQFVGQYRFLDDLNSTLGVVFTYLSGDNGGSGSYNAWRPLYENQTPAEIFNALFQHTNAVCAILQGSIMPQEDLTLTLQYTWARLANSYQHGVFYTPYSGSERWYQVNPDKKNAGNEINAHMVYDYTEDVQLKLSGAWFMPGSFFTSDNDSTAYSVRAGVNVDF